MNLDKAPPARVLQLATGHNFRDIGGYPTRDGRRVKWRHVFRSGYMSKITGDDQAQLHDLGIDTICDLRANHERRRSPTAWHVGTGTEIWSRDYEFSAGALSEIVARPDVMAEDMHVTMLQLYRELPFEQAASYREMFGRLAAGRVPLLFNCSAGKDRTGVASALLLALLGVGAEDIEHDYLITNEFIDGLISYMENDPRYGRLVAERLDHAMPLLRAEREYIAMSFAVIGERFGGVAEYLEQELEIDRAAQEAIRGHLLV